MGRPRDELQQERLLAAMLRVSALQGSEQATVARVSAAAGVSRASFYRCFGTREDCLLAALERVQGNAVAFVRRGIERRPAKEALIAAVDGLVEFAEHRPSAAALVSNDAAAGAGYALRVREWGIAEIAQLVDDAHSGLDDDCVAADIGSAPLLAGVQRLLATRLRRGEHELTPLQNELRDLVGAYARPLSEHGWRNLRHTPRLRRSPFIASAKLQAPPPVGHRGPRRRMAETVVENRRLRVIFATAETMRHVGYRAGSVREIARRAELDPRSFYELFRDKRDALEAVHEYVFQQTMAVTAGAFFSAETWPARIWDAARAGTQFLEQNPVLEHAALIESHAGNLERFESLASGFTIFLQEGYEHEPCASVTPPTPLALEAVGAVCLETLKYQARTNTPLPELVPHLAYLSLTPFLGPSRASELIRERINTET